MIDFFRTKVMYPAIRAIGPTAAMILIAAPAFILAGLCLLVLYVLRAFLDAGQEIWIEYRVGWREVHQMADANRKESREGAEQ